MGAIYPAKDLITDSHSENEVQDDDNKNANNGRDSNDNDNGVDENRDKDNNNEVQEDEDEDYKHVKEEDYEHVEEKDYESFEDNEGDGYYDDRIMQYICNSFDSEAWDGSMNSPHRKIDHFEEDDKYSPHTQRSLDLDRGDVDYLFMMEYLEGYASN